MNEKRIVIKEYLEANCPYCRYVEISVIKDIIAQRDTINRTLVRQGMRPLPIIELKIIDVDANIGSQDSQWFENYSDKISGRYTPVIEVGDTGRTYYLWGSEKKEQIEQKELSATAKLKQNIIGEIQKILTSVDKKGLLYDKEYYNPKRQLHIPNVKQMYTPIGGFTS